MGFSFPQAHTWVHVHAARCYLCNHIATPPRILPYKDIGSHCCALFMAFHTHTRMHTATALLQLHTRCFFFPREERNALALKQPQVHPVATQPPCARRDVELRAINETQMGGTDGRTDSFFLHMFPGGDSRMSAASLAQASLLLSQAEPFAPALFSALQRLGALAGDTATHPGTAPGSTAGPSGWPGLCKMLSSSQA